MKKKSIKTVFFVSKHPKRKAYNSVGEVDVDFSCVV